MPRIVVAMAASPIPVPARTGLIFGDHSYRSDLYQ